MSLDDVTKQVFAPNSDFVANAHVDAAKYDEMYAASVNDPDAFWGEHGKRIDWIKPFSVVKNTSYAPGNVSIKWFEDGTLNVSANCVDRHLETRGDQTAIIFEPDEPTEEAQHITYRELHGHVSRMANILKDLGVGKGDRVILYLPMIPEAAYAMLACARIGAIHSIVFAGFSPDALAARIDGCEAKLVITADFAPRGGRKTPLKANADLALDHAENNPQMLVVRRTGGDVAWVDGRDHDYNALVETASADCPPAEMNAEDPLFILYTSGSTGQPKGVVHCSGGYLVWASMTHEITFDYHDGDIYWCTADVGWVTGHSYIVYGPLANGATTVMFEGTPTYPDASRFWQVCEKHKVNQFYTAPTALRALMGQGNEFVEKCDLSDLKVLGTVGEPINPEAWTWYHEVVGKGNCPIVDTWWQTETGGHMMTPLPGAHAAKPGAAMKPFFGVQPVVLEPTSGEEIHEYPTEGVLCMKDSWPGQMRTVWGDHERFEKTYFSDYKNYYFAGDGCRRDDDGDYWITGRVDDVINVSGHRMGTAEVESALVAHEAVAEAAVVGYPHDIKGQGIYCYVTLMNGVEPTEELRKELRTWVRTEIGPIASPDLIQWAPGLPKTRSGKIMRRILRKIAENDYGALGDTSTLADPTVVDELIDNRMNKD
ncbi:Acetyl-coenzyme A synthetase [Aliiroseovarius sp. xm-m-379]|uniref:Acetyl-coenzyme A synthetase n=1 Tax=Aliiroseovarius crassostreae TaxID=154981 RepID=A0A9Q9HD69_9RHOB|nr:MULTISPECIES: acetate--CoA ligase [unclassified Aliiroseovarius]NRP25085.1 Acetyl-coenzyme A synthetase [Aliiroseovarius sp. xm-m-379]NRP33884.1 Acetyl-coenzyme A synthetase [Aliiroseovarius sp. xm-a-104]NRP45372.1 Acetyl-coenzyme A synthetase [Aliiroseovarius sp. xm-m-378]NRP50563.1 Acetyl-coenzyme A synthetase [Aliiroseovarius sp. xm-m-354]NRP66242.1 Acetyl-coenzyme A synthetase [Aliiroseovarius sp. xm-v-225]NRP93266.1 Acetyl-coenzyme A synthetase [Aliiroseovarius sp. xm-a-134]NRQ05315.